LSDGALYRVSCPTLTRLGADILATGSATQPHRDHLGGRRAVDDVGRAVNPMIVHGQTHGGLAQGVGQALLENSHYDPATGQLLAASFMDYAMPRADTFPQIKIALSEVPSPTNPLGVRSGGEGGTTPALAAVINAIVDALSELGVRHIEMPATPERVWRAIHEASARATN
jgi:aerobic carbon-monoxide dehydrogenase large subunit